MMDGRKPLDRFDLENKVAANHKIQPLVAEQLATIGHWIAFLSLKRYPRNCELEGHSLRVNVLEKPRPERAVDCNAASDRVVNELLEFV
jgi:hypothetical protein